MMKREFALAVAHPSSRYRILVITRGRPGAEVAEAMAPGVAQKITYPTESHRKRLSSTSAGGDGSTGSNTRKRRSRRQNSVVIPPVALALDDDEKLENGGDGKKEVNKKEDEKVAVVGEEAPGSGEEVDAMGKLPCMDRLREELLVLQRSFIWFWLDLWLHS